ncbi:hypothetical protein ID850_14795 [Xenorhabdus sp. Flor]|uniref:hypothetical protein n=1 Tax=Xenorhabdus cabanillasii TaxID=351673 RepID=UPI001995C3D3|nr:hypothetical protein [Xenorhabdus sp. Flor]MBD2815999.1 hypothetical protein [Xenorhabdus sp. Flor]
MKIKEEIDKKNTPPPQEDYSVTATIPDQSDIVIGQYSYITIILSGQQQRLRNIKDITIEFTPDIANLVTWKVEEQWEYAGTKGDIGIRLSIDKTLDEQQHKEISYTVNLWLDKEGTKPVTNYTPKKFTYKVKRINPDTAIELLTDNEYIQPPATDNPVETGKIFITYSGQLIDNQKKPLKNTQVVVASALSNQIYSDNPDKILVNIGTAPDSGSSVQILTHRDRGIDYFTVNSDKNGYIKFRVYPKKNISARIDFMTGILEVTSISYAASAYIFSNTNQSDDPFGPLSPNIYNVDQLGKLQKLPGSKEMQVGISPYLGRQSTDALIFFIQGYEANDKPIQLKPIYQLSGVDGLDGYPFNFTYDQLPLDKLMKLYYIIAPASQDSLYSMSSRFMYVGEQSGDSDNDGNNVGVYEKVEVYSSYSPYPFSIKNAHDNDRMYDNRLVTLDTINQYIKRNTTITNETPIGLYVAIKIAKNDVEVVKGGLPPLGSTCTLTIDINSATRTEHKSYPPIQLTNNTDYYQIIPIPYCDLTRAQGWEDGVLAKLSFFYEIEYAGSTRKSKTWKATIGTANTASDIDDDGCPKPKKS